MENRQGISMYEVEPLIGTTKETLEKGINLYIRLAIHEFLTVYHPNDITCFEKMGIISERCSKNIMKYLNRFIVEPDTTK